MSRNGDIYFCNHRAVHDRRYAAQSVCVNACDTRATHVRFAVQVTGGRAVGLVKSVFALPREKSRGHKR